MSVFKWNTLMGFGIKLGKGAELINKIFQSQAFWTLLKEAHIVLKTKYPMTVQALDKNERNAAIFEYFGKRYKEQFLKYIPKDLGDMKNKMDSFIYASAEASRLRRSESVEDNAAFLVRWGQELFPAWATKMEQLYPGVEIDCDPVKTSYEQNVLQIQAKILKKQRKNIHMSWKNISDTLRASIKVSSVEKLLDVVNRLEKQADMEILRIKPRFG